MGQAGNVANPERAPARCPKGREKHEAWRDPREAGNSNIGKGGCENQTGYDGQQITAPRVEISHPPQVARKLFEGNAEWKFEARRPKSETRRRPGGRLVRA